jgi:hypothetical protein
VLPYRSKRTLRIEDYRVQPADQPGWVRGTTRTPRVGEEIFCAAGLGIVTGLGGKTGDGSRLIHIQLSRAERQPYLAAASNVLLPPLDVSAPEAEGAGRSSSPAPAARTVTWFGGGEPAGGVLDGSHLDDGLAGLGTVRPDQEGHV